MTTAGARWRPPVTNIPMTKLEIQHDCPTGNPALEYGPLRIQFATPSYDGYATTQTFAGVNPMNQGVMLGHEVAGIKIGGGLQPTGDRRATLTSKVSATPEAPHWFWSVAGALVTGATRFFRTGLGFSGPTNFVPLDTDDLFSYESYMISALTADSGETVCIFTKDHRDFLARTQVYNRVFKTEFRNRKVTGNDVYLECGFSTECIPIAKKKSLDMPGVFFVAADSPEEALETAAQEIAAFNQARVPDEQKAYFCNWYEKRSFFDRKDLDRVLEHPSCDTFSIIQIDDGYAAWGDWLITNDRWPLGMQEAADAIKAKGKEAGIWLAPCTAEEGGEIWNNHPDWILKDLDGNPIRKMEADEYKVFVHAARYPLDLSHPEVIPYLKNVFATLTAWGYTAFKTDFMDWGYVDSTTVSRATGGKTSAQWFNLLLREIREAIGPDAYWLACISYFQPFVGICDGMRIASDVSEHWNNETVPGNDGIGGGTLNMILESYYCQYFNNVLWQNDPDVIFLREHGIQFTDTEIESLALWAAFTGSALTVSDFFDQLREDRWQLWQFIHPRGTKMTARLPFWTRQPSPYVAVRDYSKGTAVLVFNTGDKAAEIALDTSSVTESTMADAWIWTPAGHEALGKSTSLNAQLAPHASRLFWLGDGPPPATLSGQTPQT